MGRFADAGLLDTDNPRGVDGDRVLDGFRGRDRHVHRKVLAQVTPRLRAS